MKRVLKQVQRMLPAIVKDSVESMVKLALTNEFENALKPTVSKLFEDVYSSSSADASQLIATGQSVSHERRLKSLEHQIKNVQNNVKHIDFSDQIDAIHASLNKSEANRKAVQGTLSGLQSQIAKLKTECKPIEESTLESISFLKTFTKDVNMLRNQMIKVDDIENFQGFVSAKYDHLEKTVIEHSKKVCDAEDNLRTELQGGLNYIEKDLKSLKKELVQEHSLNQKANARIDELKEKDDIDEQYSRRNCLEIHGVIESKGENTNDIAIDIFRYLNLRVTPSQIDRSHRMKSGPRTNGRNLPRPIIVKLVNHDLKEAIFERRNRLRKLPAFRNVFINENLTVYRKKLYRDIRKLSSLGYINWTLDGNIFTCKGPYTPEATVHRITHRRHYNKLVEQIDKNANLR